MAEQTYIFMVWPQDYINSTVFYHNIVLKGLNHLGNLYNVILFPYIFYIMFIWSYLSLESTFTESFLVSLLPKISLLGRSEQNLKSLQSRVIG